MQTVRLGVETWNGWRPAMATAQSGRGSATSMPTVGDVSRFIEMLESMVS